MQTHSARALTVAVAAALLVGCSTGGGSAGPEDPQASGTTREPATGTTSSSTASPEPGGSPAPEAPVPQRDLERVIRRLPASLAFGYALEVDGRLHIDAQGTFRAPLSWASRTEVHDPSTGEVTVMNSVSMRREQWMQMESWPEHQRGCWLPLPPDKVPVGFQWMRTGVPIPLHVRDRLKSTAEGYGVRFDLASSLLSSQAVEAAGLHRHAGTTTLVPVEATVTDKAIESISVRGKDILDAVPSGRCVERRAVASIEQKTIDLAFAPGRSVEIARPAPRSVAGSESCPLGRRV